MNERTFEVARIEELPDRSGWIPIRRHFGIAAFGVNAWKPQADGERVISEHDEKRMGHEELYFVARGHATFTVAGEEIDAPAGTLVFVRDPALRRGAVAREPDTLIFTVGAKAGEAFDVSPWELWSDVQPHYEAKDYGKAIEVLEQGLVRHPGSPGLLYNLACCESLAGKREQALAHLREAIELDPDFVEYARTDEDFDPIRDNPAFESAIAGKPHSDGAGS